jgi:ankyrin repeat protein
MKNWFKYLIIFIFFLILFCNKEKKEIKYENYFNFKPIVVAVIEDNFQEVQSEINKGVNVNEIYGPYNISLLHASAETSYDISLLLIKNGAKVNYQDNGGKAPLHMAVEKNRYKIVKLLIENGATIDIRNNGQRTPLHIASKFGYLKIIFLLLKNGADVNSKDGGWRDTPLHYAVKNGRIQTAMYLLNNGAFIDAKNRYGATPLHYAVIFKNIELVELLLKNNADPNSKIGERGYWDFDGYRSKKIYQAGATPLSIAEAGKNEKIINLIKEYSHKSD